MTNYTNEHIVEQLNSSIALLKGFLNRLACYFISVLPESPMSYCSQEALQFASISDVIIGWMMHFLSLLHRCITMGTREREQLAKGKPAVSPFCALLLSTLESLLASQGYRRRAWHRRLACQYVAVDAVIIRSSKKETASTDSDKSGKSVAWVRAAWTLSLMHWHCFSTKFVASPVTETPTTCWSHCNVFETHWKNVSLPGRAASCSDQKALGLVASS